MVLVSDMYIQINKTILLLLYSIFLVIFLIILFLLLLLSRFINILIKRYGDNNRNEKKKIFDCLKKILIKIISSHAITSLMLLFLLFTFKSFNIILYLLLLYILTSISLFFIISFLLIIKGVHLYHIKNEHEYPFYLAFILFFLNSTSISLYIVYLFTMLYIIQ